VKYSPKGTELLPGGIRVSSFPPILSIQVFEQIGRPSCAVSGASSPSGIDEIGDSRISLRSSTLSRRSINLHPRNTTSPAVRLTIKPVNSVVIPQSDKIRLKFRRDDFRRRNDLLQDLAAGYLRPMFVRSGPYFSSRPIQAVAPGALRPAFLMEENLAPLGISF